MDEHVQPHRDHHHSHAAAPPTAVPVKAGAKYTCPMHPQIVRDAPGSCPLCGMALVPIGAAAADADDSELREPNSSVAQCLPAMETLDRLERSLSTP